jgi:hypothetical protein
MDYTNNPGTNQHPNTHDYQMLEQIYAHLDSITTVKRVQNQVRHMPPAMRDIEFEGIGQWGKLIDVSPDGHQTMFELDFGNGYKVLTHVYWIFDVREGLGEHD